MPSPDMQRGRSARAGPAAAAAALLLLLVVVALPAPLEALPIVDPGLFVILGVRTCGGGDGYCLLGTDCTTDRDFAADPSGHCEGLRAAFTPAAHFSCCKYVERDNATLPGEPADTTTEDPAAAAATTVRDDAENAIETEVKVEPAGTDKHAVIPIPPGPASGQTVVAVSDEYDVKDSVDELSDEEEAEVVAVAGADKEAVLESPSCRSSSSDVNPCWRSSFLDGRGTTLCSGTLVGVDAVVTTAVCAGRLVEAGTTAVTLRVDDFSLLVRDVIVHHNYRGGADDAHDIAVVRLLLAGGPGGPGGAGGPSTSCIACLPPSAANGTQLFGKTCFALAARLNGLGVETSAVCAGRVAAVAGLSAPRGGHMKLSGCEVASLKSPLSLGEAQSQAVRAREGAAMLCDGALAGLASTQSGSYTALSDHLQWLLRALAAPRTNAGFHV